jgi:hypothetical protein
MILSSVLLYPNTTVSMFNMVKVCRFFRPSHSCSLDSPSPAIANLKITSANGTARITKWKWNQPLRPADVSSSRTDQDQERGRDVTRDIQRTRKGLWRTVESKHHRFARRCELRGSARALALAGGPSGSLCGSGCSPFSHSRPGVPKGGQHLSL